MVGTKSKNSDINTEESSSHSNLTLSEEEMELIKSNVIKSITAVLPEILQELVSLIIEKSETLINENITKGLETCRRYLPDNLNVNKEVNSFIRRNNDHWQKELEKRKDVYYKFTRSDQLMP